MRRDDSDFKELLRAMMDSRVVILSLVDQLGLRTFRERELAEICRKCAIALVHRKPAIASAIKAGIKSTRHRGPRMKRK
jgi:hypothetical protein